MRVGRMWGEREGGGKWEGEGESGDEPGNIELVA